MPNLMLSWSQALVVGVVLLILAAAWPWCPSARRGPAATRCARWTAPFARESAVIAFLYSAWQFAADWSINGTTGAMARARWIDRTERSWHLPSEADLERPLLAHAWLGQVANVYYATMHFTGLFVLLLWMFLRHREQYGRVRTATAIFTGLVAADPARPGGAAAAARPAVRRRGRALPPAPSTRSRACPPIRCRRCRPCTWAGP